MIKETNGRWTCDQCGYEFSAMLGDDEIPYKCPACISQEEAHQFKIDRRIQFIEGFMTGINDQLKALQEEVRTIKKRLGSMAQWPTDI